MKEIEKVLAEKLAAIDIDVEVRYYVTDDVAKILGAAISRLELLSNINTPSDDVPRRTPKRRRRRSTPFEDSIVVRYAPSRKKRGGPRRDSNSTLAVAERMLADLLTPGKTYTISYLKDALKDLLGEAGAKQALYYHARVNKGNILVEV